MIKLVSGSRVRQMLADVRDNAAEYSRVLICSPTIDVRLQDDIVRLAQSIERTSGTMKIMTRSDASAELNAALQRSGAIQRTVVRSIPGLHAKAYVAISHRDENSSAIVPSANLTVPAATHSVELGVCASATTASGQQLLSDVTHFLETMDRKRSFDSPATPRRSKQ